MMRTWFLVMFAFLGSARADDFPQVQAEAWRTGYEATSGTAAIYLEKSVLVAASHVEFRQRIRVAGEAGKAAVEFGNLGKDAYDVAGRTLHPGGVVVPFTRKDLQTKTVVRSGYEQVDRTVLIPPGVTADCIVDIKWKEPKKYFQTSETGFGSMEMFMVSEPYPVLRAVVEVPMNSNWAWFLLPGKSKGLKRGERAGSNQFELLNLPPAEEVPYSVPSYRDPCMLLMWSNPMALRGASREGFDRYWSEFGKLGLQRDFESSRLFGRTYRTLSEELRKDRPAGNQEFARELAFKIQERIRNVSVPTAADKASMGKGKTAKDLDGRDIQATVERGFTNGWGMVYLYYHLLRDAGIQPKIALVADKDLWRFNQQLLSFQQFNDVLIGIEEPGKGTLWVDPAWRFAAPGLISMDYQGTQALVYDSAAWTATVQQIPVQGATANQRHDEYRFELKEDEDAFETKTTFSGLLDARERRKFIELEPKEQGRLLKEESEKNRLGISLNQADVLDALEPRKPLRFAIAGRIEREAGRRRTFEPFPLTPLALWVPDRLEETRNQFIAVPFARVRTAECRFTLPPGYRLAPVERMDRRNEYGTVSWNLESDNSAGVASNRVALRVEISKTLGVPASYPAFKEFLGWIREAGTRTLVLERGQ